MVAKIWRANEHLQILTKEIEEFVNPDFYEVRTETYRQQRETRRYPRREIEVRGLRDAFPFREVDSDTLELGALVDYKAVTATVQRAIPSVRWAVQVGDVVNNIRSALDNLTWALTDAESGPPPYPIPRQRGHRSWRDVRFPVALNASSWDNAVMNNLWGLRPVDQTRLKKLQPFYRRKNPNRHWLAVMDELWVADKHRNITVTRAYHGWESMQILPADLQELIEVRLLRARDFGPFMNDTEEIARIRLSPRKDRLFTGKVSIKFDVKVRLTFEVAFDDGPPAYGANVVNLLKGFMNRAIAVIYEIQPDFPEPLPVNILIHSTVQSAPPSNTALQSLTEHLGKQP